MSPSRHTPTRVHALAFAVCLALGVTFAPVLWCGEPAATTPAAKSSPNSSSTTNAPATDAPAKPAKRHLTGAELYSIHCNRCHPERYPTERTAAQWKTIMLHMQVRANLPVEQARMILKYLQENSGR